MTTLSVISPILGPLLQLADSWAERAKTLDPRHQAVDQIQAECLEGCAKALRNAIYRDRPLERMLVLANAWEDLGRLHWQNYQDGAFGAAESEQLAAAYRDAFMSCAEALAKKTGELLASSPSSSSSSGAA